MKSVVYLSNSFPEPVEPYVWEEIAELRARYNVVACSFRRPFQVSETLAGLSNETFYAFPLCFRATAIASWLSIWNIRAARPPPMTDTS